ncbi:MAG: DMT family transporter [Tannerellaceae bacterium]|nr:DMT family transporter [Tannerellaceae bacterium]
MRGTFIKLHFSVLLAGATGLFGKLITLNEGLLVWYRMMFAAILLGLFLLLSRRFPKIGFRDFSRIALVGSLLALHWVFFYGSIKAANVSVGVVCFSLVSFFTAWLEPVLLKQRFSFRELSYSLLALIGVLLIFSLDIRFRTGILLGIISSFWAALFTIATRRTTRFYPPKTILLYEMVGGCLLITCLLPVYLYFFPVASVLPDKGDFLWLLVFVVFCTLLLQFLQIQVLQHLSAFTVNLSYNLEPIYSIILAMLIFHEARELTPVFYLGIGFIVLSVFLQMRQSYRQNTPFPS